MSSAGGQVSALPSLEFEWESEGEASGFMEPILQRLAGLWNHLVQEVEFDFAGAEKAVVSIALVDDETIQKINHEYRGFDKPTNVLSFPSPADQAHFGGEVDFVLGELILSEATCRREAKLAGLAFEHHFTHLIVHGLLHLLGYDHACDDEAEEMEALEAALLARLNIANPYN